jgi:hypothetical protein
MRTCLPYEDAEQGQASLPSGLPLEAVACLDNWHPGDGSTRGIMAGVPDDLGLAGNVAGSVQAVSDLGM